LNGAQFGNRHEFLAIPPLKFQHDVNVAREQLIHLIEKQ
jgi:hypothetical protein